jgi:NADH dehydrogenase [ubiquinone] 1 alpha subcomplex assembly factor 7
MQATGPISIAAYMRQCLTSPDGGYYSSSRSADPSTDPFGAKGDFITSPEISQIFGELVGLWFMTEWMAQGRPRIGVQLIEYGPGRGTLMSDILRTASQFKAFSNAIAEVWLIEAGPALREKQREVLCGEGSSMVEKQDESGKWWETPSKFGGVTVKWVEDAILLPQAQPTTMPFVIAHEFFDALPIHAFESVAPTPEPEKTQLIDKDGQPMIRPSSASKQPQWRELMVVPAKRKFSLLAAPEGSSSSDPEPDFRLTHAHASNPMSLVLPEMPRYRHLKSTPGSRIEISPESLKFVGSIASRIGAQHDQPKSASGAALIIDYGPDSTIPINSLRGIRSHKVISPFAFPGQADLSADVDFTALADAALEASPRVEVHGPVEQGMWLTQLGIQDRAERLLKSMAKQSDTSEESERRAKEFDMGWRRLVEGGPRGMGKSYKVMAILPEGGGKRRPVGFGGSVIG